MQYRFISVMVSVIKTTTVERNQRQRHTLIKASLIACTMWVLFISVILLAESTLMYRQNDYIVVPERMELCSFNQKYMNVSISNFKYNRTALAHNVTYLLKRDFGNTIRVNIQGYKFASNEYRLFALTFSINLCETLNRDDFGLQNIYKCGMAGKCPLMKGNYKFCNWVPDYSKFPPHAPLGRYRIDLKFVNHAEELAYVQYYGKIISAKWRN